MVIPETRNDTPEAFDAKVGSSVTYPECFSLPSTSFSPGKSGDLSTEESAVEYQLVGHILYARGVASAHYTAQLVIGDMTYNYDSAYSNGRLYNSDAVLSYEGRRRPNITSATRNHSMALYHRASDVSVRIFLQPVACLILSHRLVLL